MQFTKRYKELKAMESGMSSQQDFEWLNHGDIEKQRLIEEYQLFRGGVVSRFKATEQLPGNLICVVVISH
jgi:hypothetical protein